MQHSIFVLVLLGGSLIAGAPSDMASQDLKKLEGAWETVALTYNGRDFLADGKKGFQFIFKGNEAVVEGNDAVKKEYARIKVKLDPSTTPKIMDITVAGGVQLGAVIEGIYELKKDEMKICAKVFGNERPGEFASAEGSSVVLLVLKRRTP